MDSVRAELNGLNFGSVRFSKDDFSVRYCSAKNMTKID